ncbi:hypothetical protein BV25DRAFT_227757 [Artomyces pyxidatus]|uniref:Uncharacterized protein n=2 Tax=Artomyces pyxidatus TaxID=48021 RepID=A0ACB8SFZ0_9AGAM|nr:hypothetical protein BV25DRAFT_290076 [Artomyces pyxidatus]KAI0055300.1 hypothetical protein BV25DRAFT_227757 [Artomyces pyxidatus]
MFSRIQGRRRQRALNLVTGPTKTSPVQIRPSSRPRRPKYSPVHDRRPLAAGTSLALNRDRRSTRVSLRRPAQALVPPPRGIQTSPCPATSPDKLSIRWYLYKGSDVDSLSLVYAPHL